jgi:hypothetical protein
MHWHCVFSLLDRTSFSRLPPSGEIPELKEELRSFDKPKKKDAVKKVCISTATVSHSFSRSNFLPLLFVHQAPTLALSPYRSLQP